MWGRAGDRPRRAVDAYRNRSRPERASRGEAALRRSGEIRLSLIGRKPTMAGRFAGGERSTVNGP